MSDTECCRQETLNAFAIALEANKESISYLRSRVDRMEEVIKSLATLSTHMDYLRTAVVELTAQMKELEKVRASAQSTWKVITLTAGGVVGIVGFLVFFMQLWDRFL